MDLAIRFVTVYRTKRDTQVIQNKMKAAADLKKTLKFDSLTLDVVQATSIESEIIRTMTMKTSLLSKRASVSISNFVQ